VNSPTDLSALARASATPTLAERRRRSTVRRRGRLLLRALLVADAIALTVAFFASEEIYGRSYPVSQNRLASSTEILVFFATLPILLFILSLYGLYRQDEERTDHSTADDAVPVLNAVTVGIWLFQGGSWITGLAEPRFPKVFTFWALSVALVVVGRAVARQYCHRSPAFIQNTVILGADDLGCLVARKLLQHPEYGLNLLGFIDVEAPQATGPAAELPHLGTVDELPEILRERDVERVIIAGQVAGSSETETVHML
jgi:FlaA1/EpsC-like NDP-sugar epimerase